MFRVQRAGILTLTAVVVGLEVLRCSCEVDNGTMLIVLDVALLIERSRSDASTRSISGVNVLRKQSDNIL
jgi:hypothetical protein